MFMSSPVSSPDFAACSCERDSQRHRVILNELIEMGADMARMVHQQTTSQVEATPRDAGKTAPAMGELGVVFDRLVRCVRRTALLARKLAEPLPAAASAPPRVAARQRIIRGVEDAIQFEVGAVDKASLHAELLDRLDSADLEDDIGVRPVGEIIAEICHDLGLDRMPGRHPWARRTPADLIVLRARAEAAPRLGGPAACAVGSTPQPDGNTEPQPVTRCRDP